MSLWGATVITNMLSAVPWIGQDFVQFVTPTLLFTALGVLYISMPTIGTVNTKALRGALARSDEDKAKYANVPYSFLSMFVGLVDGDGYIKITKTTTGYISMELVLSLDIQELPMLTYIRNTLGVGRLATYPNLTMAKLIIGRVDLQEVVFPLMLHHGLFFLTDTRRAQFDKAMYILVNNIVLFGKIPQVVPMLFPLPSSAVEYLSLPFFNNWIVGFTIAEGSFYVKASGEFVFSLKQRAHATLFDAFNLVFKSNTKIDMNGGYMKYAVSSVKNLTSVVDFFSYSDLHPLIGLKGESYNTWISKMKLTPRFKSVRLPNSN